MKIELEFAWNLHGEFACVYQIDIFDLFQAHTKNEKRDSGRLSHKFF